VFVLSAHFSNHAVAGVFEHAVVPSLKGKVGRADHVSDCWKVPGDLSCGLTDIHGHAAVAAQLSQKATRSQHCHGPLKGVGHWALLWGRSA
jgi:hypothetical protein